MFISAPGPTTANLGPEGTTVTKQCATDRRFRCAPLHRVGYGMRSPNTDPGMGTPGRVESSAFVSRPHSRRAAAECGAEVVGHPFGHLLGRRWPNRTAHARRIHRRDLR